MPPSKLYEGPTIEDALTAAAVDLGSEVEVVEATKKRDGGLFGFFARERFVVLAKSAEPDEPATPDFGDLLLGMASEVQDTYQALNEGNEPGPSIDSTEEIPTAEADPVIESVGVIDLRSGRRVQRDVPKPASSSAQRDVTEILKARAAVLAAEPAPAIRVADAVVFVIEGQTAGLVDIAPEWSVAALAELGLPEPVLHYVEAFAPVSDIEWLHAVAGAIGRLLRDGSALDGIVRVAGVGRGAAVELVQGIADGRLPVFLTVDGEKVRATPDELALSIRDCLS